VINRTVRQVTFITGANHGIGAATRGIPAQGQAVLTPIASLHRSLMRSSSKLWKPCRRPRCTHAAGQRLMLSPGDSIRGGACAGRRRILQTPRTSFVV